MNKNYLYPSFDTIAGSGKNGAIVHYRAKKENCRIIKKKIFFYVTLVVNINMEQLM
jgi:Xaa-Pro aminopeptidase